MFFRTFLLLYLVLSFKTVKSSIDQHRYKYKNGF